MFAIRNKTLRLRPSSSIVYGAVYPSFTKRLFKDPFSIVLGRERTVLISYSIVNDTVMSHILIDLGVTWDDGIAELRPICTSFDPKENEKTPSAQICEDLQVELIQLLMEFGLW